MLNTNRVTFFGVLIFAAAFGFAACGSQFDEQADPLNEVAGTTQSNDPTTTAGEIDGDGTIVDSTANASEEATTPQISEVSFSGDILPVLERSCASCHNEGQAGASGMPLSTAADAAENAAYIELVTAAHSMPPWPASEESVDFVGDHSLTETEIAQIALWSSTGGDIDVDPATPIVSSQAPSFLEDPEIVMTSALGAYTGSVDTQDDYRCLIMEPGNTEQEWILATQFVPDQVEVVHHGIVSLASQELRDQADWLDASQEGPGWTCYGGTGLQVTEGYQRRLAGWAPGAQPARLPDGYAIPLNPGDFIIVSIHYHYDGTPPADLSQFQIDLASDEEIAAQGGQYRTIQGARYLGPAEIPCYEGDTEPLCDRDLAIERVRAAYGDFIGGLPNYFLWNCGSTVEDYADMTDGTAWSTCDLPVTNPGRIIGMTGHMHELGLSIRLTLNPDTPEERILLDIPDWDFEWQLGYQPIEEIIIDADDTIRVDCAWNRERAPYEPVGYIVWSDGTGDEMCFSTITTAPVD